MHKGIYDTSFSNMQTIYAGQGGTTSGRLTANKKKFKNAKEKYDAANKEQMEDLYRHPVIIKDKLLEKEFEDEPSLDELLRGKNAKKSKANVKKKAKNKERLANKNNDRKNHSVNTIKKTEKASQKVEQGKLSYTRFVINTKIPRPIERNEDGIISNDLISKTREFVGEFNQNRKYTKLQAYIKSISASEVKLFRDYFNKITTGRLVQGVNREYMIIPNTKEKCIRIITKLFRTGN